MSMEIGDIEIAFYDLKEQLEINSVRVDRIEERLDMSEKDMRKVVESASSLWRELAKVMERIISIERIFNEAVRRAKEQ